MKPLTTLIAVGAGGAIGSVLRYAVTLVMVERFGPGFPWHTLTINILGSFFIGAVSAYVQSATGVPPALGAFLTVGVLGGFTTFSTFAYDTLTLVNDGAAPLAAAYCVGSVALGVGAAVAGVAIARAVIHAA